MNARVYNLGFGLWIFASGFLWRHSPAQFSNAWIVGAAIMAFALIGLRLPALGQYTNLALGAWLVLSSVFLPHFSAVTQVNHIFAGMAVMVLSMLPSLPGGAGRRGRPHIHPRPRPREAGGHE
jgi:hypothetical protein